MTPPGAARDIAAEALGTLLLVAVVVGSGIMAARLSGANAGVALLANTLATAAGLYVLVAVLAPVSGAHFNPVVTLVAVLSGALPARRALGFVVAQCAGGVLGTWLAHAMFGLSLLQLSSQARSGTGAVLSEAVAAFWLVTAILGGAARRPDQAPAIVAMAIAAGYWFTASTCFANPAVTLARALSDSFTGIAPASVPGFVLAQAAGGVAAWAAAGWFGWLPRQARTISAGRSWTTGWGRRWGGS